MLILLITHIIIALGGLAAAAVALYTLSEKTIRLSHGLAAGTIATGTVLVVFGTSNILKSCLSGLMYLAAILVLTAAAKYRLATQKSE